MNEEKIVYNSYAERLLHQLCFFLFFKEHNVVKFKIIFNVFYSTTTRHHYANSKPKELMFKHQ